MGINQCLRNHIHEPFASSTANLTGKIEVLCLSHNQDSFNSASLTSSTIGYVTKTGSDQCCRTELTCEARLSW